MSGGITELVYLLHKKNEINRKRRRFYHAMNGRSIEVCGDRLFRDFPSHLSKEQGCVGYAKAIAEGKELMNKIRLLKKKLNVSLKWGHSGNIQAINFSVIGQECRIDASKFRKMSEEYQVEMLLLGNNNG